MESYAVVETGGKQYRVKLNDTVHVERLDAEVGSNLDLDAVLAVSDGTALKVGTPQIDGVTVTTKVVDHIRADKVVSFKKKRRKGYSRKVGHRQEQTILKVEKIG
jgi:large subunit ribosomal protein L21